MEKIDGDRENGDELALDFSKRGGLVTVVAQDVDSGEVLMVAYANREAIDKTLATRYATFWSTSRNELWTKGDTSGDYLSLVTLLVDCDQDAVVYQVRPVGGGACHTRDPERGVARRSCFYRAYDRVKGKLTFRS